jgi:hypothetical protein
MVMHGTSAVTAATTCFRKAFLIGSSLVGAAHTISSKASSMQLNCASVIANPWELQENV